MSALPWLEHSSQFPPIESALQEPNGLLAAGGDLSPEMLLRAYKSGIFPWYSEDQPILWWSPDPRCIIRREWMHISKSLRKHQRRHRWQVTFDKCFDQVIQACATRGPDEGTWITPDMQDAYCTLHRLGHAHSVEVWNGDQLLGGLYGVGMHSCFFGESMFSHASNASKIAFWALCEQLGRWEYALIDCQIENPHLLSLGARPVARSAFAQQLRAGLSKPAQHSEWKFDPDLFSNV